MSREKEALETCKTHYRELFGKEMEESFILSTAFKILNEKWEEFARSRIQHLTLVELESLISGIGYPQPGPPAEPGDNVISLARSGRRNAKKDKDI